MTMHLPPQCVAGVSRWLTDYDTPSNTPHDDPHGIIVRGEVKTIFDSIIGGLMCTMRPSQTTAALLLSPGRVVLHMAAPPHTPRLYT